MIRKEVEFGLVVTGEATSFLQGFASKTGVLGLTPRLPPRGRGRRSQRKQSRVPRLPMQWQGRFGRRRFSLLSYVGRSRTSSRYHGVVCIDVYSIEAQLRWYCVARVPRARVDPFGEWG